MSNNSDCDILVRPGLTEQAIAEVLLAGPSPNFCRLLAEMLNPPAWMKKPQYRLKVVRQRGAPKRMVDDGALRERERVGRFMKRRMDEGCKYEDAVVDAEEKFKLKRHQVIAAYRLELDYLADASSGK
jgi:hypothetical protein